MTRSHLKNDFSEKAVMPAKAGIQESLKTLDSRLHGNDKEKENSKKLIFEMASNSLYSFHLTPYASRLTNYEVSK